MKKTFKTITMLLALCLLFGLAACSTGSAPADTEEPGDSAPEITTVAEGYLTMATSADFAPYEFHIMKDGKDTIVGFDVALGQAIADYLGLELVIKDMGFDSLIQEVQNGTVDISIAGFSVDPERAEAIDFTDIYYTGGQSFVILAEDADLYKSYADFKGLAVGAQTGTIQADLLAENISDANPILLTNMNDIVLQLMNNKIEGAFIETVVAENYIKSYPELQIAWEVPYDSAGSAAVVQKGNTALLDAANTVIAQVLADGSMGEWVTEANELSSQSIS